MAYKNFKLKPKSVKESALQDFIASKRGGFSEGSGRVPGIDNLGSLSAWNSDGELVDSLGAIVQRMAGLADRDRFTKMAPRLRKLYLELSDMAAWFERFT